MIDWVDAMACSWGYQLRRHARSEGDMPSLAGRIMELGPDGAAIRGTGSQRFQEGLLGDALEFHTAWQRLERMADRQILALHYVETSPVKVKAHFLGVPRSTYWQRLDYAQRRIATMLEYGQRPYGRMAAQVAN